MNNAETDQEDKKELAGSLAEKKLLKDALEGMDGAPPHFGVGVRDFLSQQFHQWIGRRGTTEWPPTSWDLTQCDFSL
ncbi:hypothetical protein ANN_19370 [Periplaneta americana]|uniref:Uncharacterized protein n=1 Tax=Periplaneta americana TaxID=6978 RepID=A0ABQ8S9S4_PERAM|nr:hypothetical protein ANN_19370 [Periplaneta americana]